MILLEGLTKFYRIYFNNYDRIKETFSFSNQKYHKLFYALKNISFSINERETVGIIGKNGSGKSTLLKIISGVLHPSKGKCIVNGNIIPLLELGAGFNPELTGIENLKLMMNLSGITDKDINKKIQEIINFSELHDFMHQSIKTYSSGMKARLAFSYAINVEPEILILDEILAVGDASFQRKCFAKIEQFKKDGKTILFVSHSIADIIELCSRVIWLDKGEIVLDGDTKLVTSLYQKYVSEQSIKINKIRLEYDKLKNISSSSLQQDKTDKIEEKFYNKSLVSKSIVEYKSKGARIILPHILNERYQKVNILKKDIYYYYNYEIDFYEDYENVNLAILLKTKTGFLLGGKEMTIDVQKGKYRIMWKFKNILNRGIYFFNTGVNIVQNGNKKILHRIIDAYMFEVLPNKYDRANNIIDFGFELDMKEMNE